MDFRLMLRVVGSLRFAAVILVLLCVAMACATVYEATHGTPAALLVFYKSQWFEILLGLLALNVLASTLTRWPWSRRHVGFLVTHASILAILGGAWVTQHWGINGQVAIAEGRSARDFTTDAEALIVRQVGQSDSRSFVLSGGIGGIKPVDRPRTGALATEGLQVEVAAYLPDSAWGERVVNDNPEPSTALEVVLVSADKTSREWIFEDNPQTRTVSVRAVRSPAEFETFLAPVTTRPASARTVKVEAEGQSFEFPLEECLAAAVPLGQTGYTLKVLRYLPHALVGEHTSLTNASDKPVNPAIEAEISGPGGTGKRVAFARFPDFGSMHGGQGPGGEVKLSLNVPAAEQSTTPVEVAAGPEGRLAVAFNSNAGPAVKREIRLGERVETPWPGLVFSVERRFDNARREQVVEPVLPPREDRVPAILVEAKAGETRREVWLRKQEPRTVDAAGGPYELAYANQIMPLGFEIKLNDFNVGTYPGTGRPRSFESHVTLSGPDGAPDNRVISMNHPAKFGGYSLFQSSYQQNRSGGMTSVLSVAWDPGLPIVFGGYVTLVIGMLYVLVIRMKARSQTDEEKATRGRGDAETRRKETSGSPGGGAVPKSKAVHSAVLMLGCLLGVGSIAEPARAGTLPSHIDANAIRGLPVQHDGRWMPLDTVARDVVNGITGRADFRGEDAVKWLLAWTFQPAAWFDEPLIAIGSAELRRELQLPEGQSVFSYRQLVRHKPLLDEIDKLRQRSGGKMNPLESKVSDINGKLIDLQQVFANEVIKPIPDPSDANAAWKPIAIDDTKPEERTRAQGAWGDLKRAFLADSSADFTKAAGNLATALSELPAAYRPTARKLAAELRYNRIRPYTIAWKLMALGAVLSLAALFVKRRWFDAVAIVGLMGGFAALSYGMSLRWQIAGRIPASNMFESLLFLSWGAGAFAIVAMVFLKDRSVPLTASAIGALALFLADTLPIDHFIRPIAPVLLDTVWMSIHVPGIMVSYAVLALAAFIAHVQMVAMALAPRNARLIGRIDAMHYWYMHVGVILLGAGIITGSMWAAFSWGRYWGWDPKEVWSLVAFLAYLVIMHVRVDHERMPAWTYGVGGILGLALLAIVVRELSPLTAVSGLALAAGVVLGVLFVVVRGQFASAFKSAVAFWFIIMTYVGVNYVLGIGLHSYGFGTGAVVHYMMLLGGINLALIGVLTIVYLARTRFAAPAPNAGTG